MALVILGMAVFAVAMALILWWLVRLSDKAEKDTD